MISLAALMLSTGIVISLEAEPADPEPSGSHRSESAATTQAAASLVDVVPWSCLGAGGGALAVGACLVGGFFGFPCSIIYWPVMLLAYGVSALVGATCLCPTTGLSTASLGICGSVPLAATVGGALLSAKLRRLDVGKVLVRALPGLALVALPLALVGLTHATLYSLASSNQTAQLSVISHAVATATYPILSAAITTGLLLGAPAIFVGVNARDD